MLKPKTSTREYDRSMLPKNRKEVFFDVMKLHWGKMLMLGFLMLLFAAPIHIYAITEDFYQMTLTAALPETATETQIASVVSAVMTFSIIRNAVNIPLFVLFSIGLAGLSRIMRQFSWGEPIDFTHDFGLGVKQNGKQFAVIALIAGIIAFVCNYIHIISDTVVSSEIYGWLGIIPSVVCAMFLIPIAGYAMVACSCYSNKFCHNFRIGRVCYFGKLWKTLLACLCCLAVFVVQMLPLSGLALLLCHLIGRLVGSVLIPIILLGWYLFAMSGLDKFVNKVHHPELVDKGVYRQSSEEITAGKDDIKKDNQPSLSVQEEHYGRA